MNCRQVQSLLSAYIDGEMPGGDMLHIRCHVVHCPCCSREEQELRSLKRVLMGCHEVEPPEELEERLLSSLMVRRQESKSNGWYMPVAVGLTAMAITLAILTALPNEAAAHTVATDIRADQSAFSSANWADGGHMAFSASYDQR